MSMTVRCPACRGVSGVDPADRGEGVRCPKCGSTFTAVPEAELILPVRPNRNPIVRNSRPTDPGDRSDRPGAAAPPAADPDHDPHRHPIGGLPASVLIGLALLPFAIPVLWFVVPVLLGQPPLLSLGVPCAIALSASVLSLAVIYTIDWSPSVRIKGVVILLTLTYFSAGSLFFLKKENVEWFKAHFGGWVPFSGPAGEYWVLLPLKPKEDLQLRPMRDVPLDCYSAVYHDEAVGSFRFVVGAGTPNKMKDPAPGTDPWFDAAVSDIVKTAQGELDPDHKPEVIQGPKPGLGPGRQFGIRLKDGDLRIVRLFFLRNRVYYLSAEGEGLNWDNYTGRFFLDSFRLSKQQ